MLWGMVMPPPIVAFSTIPRVRKSQLEVVISDTSDKKPLTMAHIYKQMKTPSGEFQATYYFRIDGAREKSAHPRAN